MLLTPEEKHTPSRGSSGGFAERLELTLTGKSLEPSPDLGEGLRLAAGNPVAKLDDASFAFVEVGVAGGEIPSSSSSSPRSSSSS